MTPPVDLYVAGAVFVEHLAHVLEELHVTTLIAGDRDALSVFLDGSGDDLFDTPVMTEMYHLGAGRLEDAAYHIDRRVVAVEERGRRDDSDRVPFGVNLCIWHTYVKQDPSRSPGVTPRP